MAVNLLFPLVLKEMVFYGIIINYYDIFVDFMVITGDLLTVS
jgi:hypothetical protein